MLGQRTTVPPRAGVCRQCGAPFIFALRGKPQAFCGKRCGWAWWRAHSRVRKREAQRLAAPGEQRTCVVCQASFIIPFGVSRKPKYCTDPCRRKAAAQRARKPIPDRLCLGCGAVISAPAGGTKRQYCSQRCGHRARVLARSAPPQPCDYCGGDAGIHGQTLRPRRFCSDRCKAAVHGAQRRARERHAFVEYVSHFAIYMRDKGVCALCRRPVDLRLKPPDSMSMTLDHVLPLSRGGKHERGNVQLAHWACNSRKGAKVGWSLAHA